MAISFDLIQPNGIQMQNLVDKPVAYPAQNESIAIAVAPCNRDSHSAGGGRCGAEGRCIRTRRAHTAW